MYKNGLQIMEKMTIEIKKSWCYYNTIDESALFFS